MKPILLTAFSLLAVTALNAQFSLQPQAGFEQSRTSLNYSNGLSALNNVNVKAGLKMDYRLKGGHSPFINLTTTPSPVSFVFDNSGTLINRVQSSVPKLMLQAGYQYSSKAIQLGKKSSSVKNVPTTLQENTATQQHRCGMYRSRCAERKANKMNAVNNALNMRLQPSLALAYIPSATASLMPKGDGQEYEAANWKTALVPSMGFEFAKGKQRLFTLNVFYTKPLTESEQTATLASGVKAVPVPLQAKTSSWGMTLGIPFSFAKTSQPKAVQNKTFERKECHRNYYRRCMRVQ